MDLQDSFYQKKLLSPEDDWDLIYKEALAARKVLSEARNKAHVKLEQLFTKTNLFFLISINLWSIGILLPIYEYFKKSGNYQDYLNSFNIVWSVLLIGASFIFFFFFRYSKSTVSNLKKEIATVEDILDKLDHELFSIDLDRKECN